MKEGDKAKRIINDLSCAVRGLMIRLLPIILYHAYHNINLSCNVT